MNRNLADDTRFGQDPADSEPLIRAWHATRPALRTVRWNEFWANARHKAAAPEPGPLGPTGGKPLLRVALAASLVICLAAFALRHRLESDDRKAGVSLAVQEIQMDPSTQALTIEDVSIDLGEDDSLAVIRTGYAECPLPNPCVEAVRAYVPGESGEASLASNFQLLNEFESIATE